MTAHAAPPHIDPAAMEKLLVVLIAHQARYPNGINEAKKAFHKVIGDIKGQLARTPQLEAAIASLIHQATDLLIQDDGDDDHENVVLGRRVRSLLQSPSGRSKS